MAAGYQDAGFAYQGTGLFAYQVGAGVAPVVVVTPVGHVGRPHRRRTFHYVVIDGKEYQVNSVREAEEILDKRREAAKQLQVTPKAALAAKPPVPPVIRQTEQPRPDNFTHELQAKIDAANAAIQASYRQAWEAAKIAADRIALGESRDQQDMQDLQELIDIGIL